MGCCQEDFGRGGEDEEVGSATGAAATAGLIIRIPPVEQVVYPVQEYTYVWRYE